MAKRKLASGKTQKFFKKGKSSSSSPNEGTKEMRQLSPFIISGGENTEHYYFKHLSAITPYKFDIRPKYFGKESNFVNDFPKRIKEILKNNADAKIYCIFDYDTIHNSDTNRKNYAKFQAAIADYINKGVVILCPTMPCFEYWFLLHFENNSQLITSCDAVDNILERYMRPYFSDSKSSFKDILKSTRHIEKPEWVKKLCNDNKLQTAIARAKSNYNKAIDEKDLDNHSFTLIFKAFE